MSANTVDVLHVRWNRYYFHFYSPAAEHPPQSARWPKPCANPRICSLLSPRKHTCTHASAQQTLMSPALICIFPSNSQTRARLYFVHRDIGINRLVRPGLSSHIHRNRGIRRINAHCSWICIRQWFETHTEDYLWHTNSLPYTRREGHNSHDRQTCTYIHGYIDTSCWSLSSHANLLKAAWCEIFSPFFPPHRMLI